MFVLSLLVLGLAPRLALASTPGGPSMAPGNPATQVPRVADGPGLKTGKNSTFHGGAALSIGFDSNVFSEVRARRPQRAAYALPSVWLTIENRPLRAGLLDTPAKSTGRKVDYHLGLLAGWRLYLTGRPTVWQASKLNIAATARVTFAPGRRFSFAIEDDFNRIGEPTNFEAGRSYNFNRFDNSAALRFLIRPSGGRLSLNVAYRNEILYFESGSISTADRIVNGAETETKYRFRDRSAFAVRYAYHYTYYLCCVDTGIGRNEDSHAHRLLGGYVGQLGKKVVLDVFGGWGWGLYKQDTSGPNHKNFIGYAALGVFPSPKTQIGLRVGRDFHDSVFGNYFTDVGGSLVASHVFPWKMGLDAGLGIYARRYAGLPIPGVDTQQITGYTAADGFVRRDTLISFNLQLEQPIGKYLVAGLRYAVAADLTDFVVDYADGYSNPGRFTRNLLMGFIAVRY
ncbi:hypothetical protein DB30_07587 [Enhygromyxa salina]|uniref:Uncharacterized protein n=1 Tax=Enhygromyxa salina TaxID=215803 RepID=A0A0C2CRF0_9BACT|nr:hypothetical protein [Enhygromyxa salina]KIG13741.1 hypothetical protein DB30_07587 [Enhygromyxa salina]